MTTSSVPPPGGPVNAPDISLAAPPPPVTLTPAAHMPEVEPPSDQFVASTAKDPKDTKGKDAKSAFTYQFVRDEDKEPTMAIVRSIATQAAGINANDPDWHNKVIGFSSEMAKNKTGSVVLKSYGDPKCFAADITFKVDVESKDGKPITVEFTQTIVTQIPIPLGCDRRKVQDAQIEALFKLTGYRQSMQEPFVSKSLNRINRIHDFVQKASLQVTTVRDTEDKGLYGRKVEWEKEPKEGTTAAKIANSYAVRGQIIGVTIEGESKTPSEGLHTLWNTRIYCEEIETQNSCLQNLEDAVTRNDANTIEANLEELRTLGLTLNQIVIMVNRNCIHDLSELKLSFAEKKPLDARPTGLNESTIGERLFQYKRSLKEIENLDTAYANVTDPNEKKNVAEHRKHLVNNATWIINKVTSFESETRVTHKRAEQALLLLGFIEQGLIPNNKLPVIAKNELKENITRLQNVQEKFQFDAHYKAFKEALADQKKEFQTNFAQLPGWT